MIITMRILDVHILEIIQLMCNVRLCPNRKYIPKALECLTFRTPIIFVTMPFYNVVAELCILNRAQFCQRNDLQTNRIYIEQEVIPFWSHGKNIFNNLLSRWEYMFCTTSC